MSTLKSHLTILSTIFLLASCTQENPAVVPADIVDIDVANIPFPINSGSDGDDYNLQYYNNNDDIQALEDAQIDAYLNDNNTADDEFYRMLKDVGGMNAYTELLNLGDDEAISDLHDRYLWSYSDMSTPIDNGPTFTSRALQNDFSVRGCEWHIRTADRGYTIKMNDDNFVVIDNVGRPFRSWVDWDLFDNVSAAARDNSCTSKVGNWGVSGDQGGHLVGAELGGWGARANVAPQNGNLNTGKWRSKIEAAGKLCENRRLYRAGKYEAYVLYDNNTTVRPSHFVAQIQLNMTSLGISPYTSFARALMKNQATTNEGRVHADGFYWVVSQFC